MLGPSSGSWKAQMLQHRVAMTPSDGLRVGLEFTADKYGKAAVQGESGQDQKQRGSDESGNDFILLLEAELINDAHWLQYRLLAWLCSSCLNMLQRTCMQVTAVQDLPLIGCNSSSRNLTY